MSQLRVRIETADGVFLVRDAVDHTMHTPSGERHALEEGRYVALWNNARTGEVFLFDRALRTGADVGHALIALERLAPNDVDVLLDQAPDLARHFDAATSAGFDGSEWRRATRAAVRRLLQVDGLRQQTGTGEVGGIEEPVFCLPCTETAGTALDNDDDGTERTSQLGPATPEPLPSGDVVENIIATVCCKEAPSCTCFSDADCDDGIYCNGSEWCSCTCRSGSSPQCADANACTFDVCDPITDSCKHTPDPGSCPDDGNFCNGEEYCDPVVGCSSQNAPCTTSPELMCLEASDECVECLNDSHCTTQELPVCNEQGICAPCTDAGCDDGIDCTKDICSLTLGICQNVPLDILCSAGLVCNGELGCVECNVDVECDDGVFCNGVEICDAAGTCQPGPAETCDDGIACTQQSCWVSQDECVYLPDNSACAAGLVCSLTLGCVECYANSHCDDGVGCTDDTCDLATNTCGHSVNHGACDNLVFCDGVEFCDPVLDCQSGSPETCDDGIPCTQQTCWVSQDECVYLPDNSACAAGFVCSLTLGCVECYTDGHCDDDIGCTGDTCNLATNTCEHSVNHSACDNGDFCDGVEVCDPLFDCQPGTPETCDDGIDCTKDICSLVLGSCQNVPIDNLCPAEQVCDAELGCVGCNADVECDDGVFCNGVEICDATGSCQPGPAETCDDGIPCTQQTCWVSQDECVYLPDNSVCTGGFVCSLTLGCVECYADSHCNDGQFCNGDETCDIASATCQSGTLVDCDDGVACTQDACWEDQSSCLNVPDNTACPAGMVCDSVLGCID